MKKNIKIENIQFTLPLFLVILLVILLNTYLTIKLYRGYVLKEDIFRLHVVANSNNISDQITKLKISKKIENYIDSLNIDNQINEKQDYINEIKSHMSNILAISDNTLKENNLDYTAYAKLGNISYDQKEAANISMEQGNYDSLEIILGKGEGKNFWSIIFPNENNIEKLESLNTILPGITYIYDDASYSENKDNNENNSKVKYKIKTLEIIKELIES